MRILAGAVVRQNPEVLRAHLQTMKWQSVDPGVQVDLFYVDDHGEGDEADECRQALADAGATTLPGEPRPEGAAYGVDEGTHHWAVPTFHHLARQKQRLLDLAQERGYDAVFLVDSDLLLGRDTLRSLLACNKAITSAVFWTRWTPEERPLPQVWQRHPYGFDGAGWNAVGFLAALEARQLVRVRGLGACTLIGTDALRRGAAFWPLVDGLPSDGMWQGEDRHFCIRAERAHIEMWADAWPEVVHCYRPSDRAAIPNVLTLLSVESAGTPLPGDEVSLTIEPCEEPGLLFHVEHVRGALRQLNVIPAISSAIESMRIGEERIVRAAFPESWPLEAYRGQSKTLRLRLLGARSA